MSLSRVRRSDSNGATLACSDSNGATLGRYVGQLGAPGLEHEQSDRTLLVTRALLLVRKAWARNSRTQGWLLGILMPPGDP